MKHLDVLDSTIAYREQGTGAPAVLLHGNPTSSHLWRNVIPGLEPLGRLLAPDLVGMGSSGKPDIEYGFADSARYLDAWFDELALDGVVLIGHDWGGALACDWAARHPQRVRAVVLFETILRPMTWEDFPGPARPRIEALRSPGSGEAKVLDENFFINVSLRTTALNPLSESDLAAYAAPYPTAESRRPLLAWPRAFPIEGDPADVHARVAAYDEWLAASADVPKLLLTFDGPPELLIIGPQEAEWCRSHVAHLDIVSCSAAGHLAPEDVPDEIAAAIVGWASRHGLVE